MAVVVLTVLERGCLRCDGDGLFNNLKCHACWGDGLIYEMTTTVQVPVSAQWNGIDRLIDKWQATKWR